MGFFKRRWKQILIGGLSLCTILFGLGFYEYYHIQPEHHFKHPPTISSDQVIADSDSDSASEDQEKIKAANALRNIPKLKENVLNILLIGSDERKGQHAGHSDSMILLHADLNKHQYNTVSIPRDTRVYLAGYGYTKLTSVQYIKQATSGSKAGIEAAVSSIMQLTGVPINYYVETNYEGLQSMVEALGTVDVDVPFDVKLTHPWYKENKDKIIKKGTQTLDGKMITELVHERYSLKRVDFDRQLLQEKVLVAIAKAALQPSNFTDLPHLVSTTSNFLIGTNMSNTDILSLGLAVKSLNPNKDIHYYQLTGHSETLYDDILKSNNSQLILDQDNLQQVMTHFR
ncbi:transcriptional regulator [Pullulanibacillus camelliae]|uniref:Transcriptional regulator n=1 Tax=Pullulanibacillus camelliae TaxID=1707096 RepID=A0A8J2VLK7_9BACL|nr:LCP family protein [Pullulanibacillus camelliae]GGE27482.1 transcriptional regulator [Pullulanibacillus camelliae]